MCNTCRLLCAELTFFIMHLLHILQKEANASLVDTDLCQFGACEDGSLVQLDLEGA